MYTTLCMYICMGSSEGDMGEPGDRPLCTVCTVYPFHDNATLSALVRAACVTFNIMYMYCICSVNCQAALQNYWWMVELRSGKS